MAEVRGDIRGASWVASGDLSGSQFRCVVPGVNNQVYLATSGSAAIGILENKPRDKQHAAVTHGGPTKAFLSGSMNLNAPFMAGVGGGITLAASGYQALGWTMTNGSSGDIIDVFVTVRPWI